MNPDKLKSIADSLATLTEIEFIDTLTRAIELRPDGATYPSQESKRICLAELYRGKDERDEWGSWDFGLLARARPNFGIVENSAGATQGGFCCGLQIFSYAKECVCPLCGTTVHAT